MLYLALSCGLVVNWHYCMGQLASIEWGVPQDDHCGKCGMKDQKGCCETESQILKVKEAHVSVKTQSGFPVMSAHDLPAFPEFTSIQPVNTVALRVLPQPPGADGPRRYVLHRVFRI